MTTPVTDKAKTDDGRWWEFYSVRYFVGTVVGAAIVLYLNAPGITCLSQLLIPGVTDASGLEVQQLFLLLAIGLAYCYISSAPILVLHATRGVFLRKNAKSYSWLFYLALVAILGISAWFYFNDVVSSQRVWAACILFSLVMFLQLIPLGISFRKEGEDVHIYYTNLTKSRSKNNEETRQYIESYKHLREHGNAFFILLFEMVLGAILATAQNPMIAFMALLLWIVPAALMWFLGTILEYRFANHSAKS